jgi:hypothetical protein
VLAWLCDSFVQDPKSHDACVHVCIHEGFGLPKFIDADADADADEPDVPYLSGRRDKWPTGWIA